MSIYDLFNELDQVVMLNFGDVDAALATERGKQVLGQLLADENRASLRAWYDRLRGRPLNAGAEDFKRRLEALTGETF